MAHPDSLPGQGHPAPRARKGSGLQGSAKAREGSRRCNEELRIDKATRKPEARTPRRRPTRAAPKRASKRQEPSPARRRGTNRATPSAGPR